MTSIKNRTSIRKYSTKEVSDKLLNQLLEDAMRTPTMGNLQLYSVVVTRSEEGKKALAPAHFNQPMVTGAPVVLTICADYRRTTLWAENRKGTPGYDNILSFMNAATDALLFTQTFTNLAEEAGLGTCFLGTTVYMPKMIIDTLKLPKLVMPVATLTIGWPDEQPVQTDRLPLRSIVHNETFEDYTPEKIDGREQVVCPHQQCRDSCPRFHRHPLHQEGLRGDEPRFPRSPQTARIYLKVKRTAKDYIAKSATAKQNAVALFLYHQIIE